MKNEWLWSNLKKSGAFVYGFDPTGIKRNVTWHVASYDSGYESVSKFDLRYCPVLGPLSNGCVFYRWIWNGRVRAWHVDGSRIGCDWEKCDIRVEWFLKKNKNTNPYVWRTRGERPLDRVREVYGSYLGTKSCAHDKDCFGPSDHGYYTVISFFFFWKAIQ